MSKTALKVLQGVFSILLAVFSIFLFYTYFAVGEFTAYLTWLESTFGEGGAAFLLVIELLILIYGGFAVIALAILASLIMGVVLLPLAHLRSRIPSILCTVATGFLAVTELCCIFLTGESFYRLILVFSTLLCFGAMIFGIAIVAKKTEKPTATTTVVYYPTAQPPLPPAPTQIQQSPTPTQQPVRQPVSWYGRPTEPPAENNDENDPNTQN